MTWKSICCGHTNWSGFALNRTGKMGHEYFKWPLSCQGTNLLAQMFFSQSHLIATQDWPQLQVSSSPSVCERSIGTVPESLFSSTIPPAGFCTGFPCDPPLAAVGLFTWSMEIPHIQVPGLAPGCQFFCGQPIPGSPGMTIIARGFPQLFSSASLAIFSHLVSEWLFWNVCPSASHHVPTLPTTWRRVGKNLALCHGKAWKAKVVDKSSPLKMRSSAAWNHM